MQSDKGIDNLTVTLDPFFWLTNATDCKQHAIMPDLFDAFDVVKMYVCGLGSSAANLHFVCLIAVHWNFISVRYRWRRRFSRFFAKA